MKQYSVSITVRTKLDVTASVVSNSLGVDTSCLNQRCLDTELLWTIESVLCNYASLEEHMQSILSLFDSNSVVNNNVISGIYCVVGVYYNTATCTINFTSKYLNMILSKFPEAVLEVVCYPCEDSEVDEEPVV